MSGGQLPPIERILRLPGENGNFFVRFMEELRSAVADPSQQQVYGLPITRPETRGTPRQWLRLTMEYEGQCIILWVRTDNLYVVGFEQRRRQGSSIFWEFGRTGKEEKGKGKDKRAKKKNDDGHSHEHLIPGSQFLGFDGDYNDLGGIEGVIGYQQIVNAIRGLASYERTPGASGVRTWLRTIIITVSESLRFPDVCKKVDDLLCRYGSESLDSNLCVMIRTWRRLSRAIIDCANNPEGDDSKRYTYMRGLCTSTEEARRIVCILDHGPAVVPPRRKREAAEGFTFVGSVGPGRANVVNDVPEGFTFVEIFSVEADVRGRNNAYVYGHVAIEDGLETLLLFSRGRTRAQLVPPGGSLLVTGPSRAAWAYGEVVLHVDLMSLSYVPDMTPDEEIGSGRLVWNTYDTTEMVYDEAQDYVFEGLSGSVNVRCALVTNAVMATVVVETSGETGNVELYGTIYASNDKFGPYDKITLFNRDDKHAVTVRAGSAIPLIRSVVVAPLGWPLMISADLWKKSFVADMTPDDQITGSTFKFYPMKKLQTKDQIIDGITVSVTWSYN